jgi:pyruvate formate lyase activating enzyme
MDEGGRHINAARCVLCGRCVEACPTNALEMLGKQIELEELSRELFKDNAFFEQSDGGVTFSGGEPALQPEFIAVLAKILQERGIHTALDTCGLVPQANLEMILPYIDLVLYDIKLMDTQQHQEFTGAGNERILENLLWLTEMMKENQYHFSLWIRTHLIPGATANKENLQAIAAFLNEHLAGRVERWELCAFNNLCRDKYARLSMQWKYEDKPLMKREDLNACQEWARQVYQDPQHVSVTGAARVEE